MNSIQGTFAAPAFAPPPAAAPSPSDGSFRSFLLDQIEQVNSMQLEADRAVENLAAGGEANPAEVLTAVQKADIAFRMMMQIRNKIVAAYEEVKQIRV